MKLPIRMLVLAQCGILFGALALASFAAPEPAPRYSRIQTEVDVQRHSASSYLFAVKVVDLATGEIMVVPALEIPEGKKVEGRPVSVGSGKARLHLSGEADPKLKKASYTVRLEQNGNLVSEHSGYVGLD